MKDNSVRPGGLPMNGAPEGSPPSVGIPDAALIPAGVYCYASLSPMDKFGRMRVNGMCPYWERRGEHNAYCAYLDASDDIVLWDQVKICGVNDDWAGDDAQGPVAESHAPKSSGPNKGVQ